jgi:hypothetical protein
VSATEIHWTPQSDARSSFDHQIGISVDSEAGVRLRDRVLTALEFSLGESRQSPHIRIDGGPAVVEFSEVSFANAAREMVRVSPDRLQYSGAAIIPATAGLALFCYADSAEVLIPESPEGYSRLLLTVQASADLSRLPELYQAALERQSTALIAELKAAQGERMIACAELSKAAEERNSLRRELMRERERVKRFTPQTPQFEIETNVPGTRPVDPSSVESQLLESTSAADDELRKALNAERAVRRNMEQSLSWRITAPLRRFAAFRRRVRQRLTSSALR